MEFRTVKNLYRIKRLQQESLFNPIFSWGQIKIKTKGYVNDLARQSILQGHGISHFLVRISTIMSLLDFSIKIWENSITILHGNGVLRILSRAGIAFRDLQKYSRNQCDYCHFG